MLSNLPLRLTTHPFQKSVQNFFGVSVKISETQYRLDKVCDISKAFALMVSDEEGRPTLRLREHRRSATRFGHLRIQSQNVVAEKQQQRQLHSIERSEKGS